MDNLARPAARLLAPATVRGLEHLQHLDGPVIFAANHASHMDTPLLLTTLPVDIRHHTVVAAASDYFFDRTWKSVLSSFALATIPIERSRVNRKSGDTAAELIEDGWNLVIFPEGGRSPDGWSQPFTAGAAYLARRTGRPVVPVYLHGTRHVLPKSAESEGVHREDRAPSRAGVARCAERRSRCSSAPHCHPTKGRTRTGSRTASRPRSPPCPGRSTPTGGRPGARSARSRRSKGPRRHTAARRPLPGAAPGPSTSPRHASEARTGPTDLVDGRSTDRSSGPRHQSRGRDTRMAV